MGSAWTRSSTWGNWPVPGFCSNVREYAYSLGKRGFFLFGEVASPDDDMINRYIGQNTSRMDDGATVFFGLDSVLDFRLAEPTGGHDGLRDVIKGLKGPQALFDRLEAQRNRALSRAKSDATWSPSWTTMTPSGSRAASAGRHPTPRSSGPSAICLCALGTPCIYYGTEQGFEGHGATRTSAKPCSVRRTAAACSTRTAASTGRSARSPR